MSGLLKNSSDLKGHAASEQARPPAGAAPGTQIAYSSGLVDALKADHRKLLALYGRINSAFKQGDYDDVSALLSEFKSGFQQHLLTENIRFYVYVERHMAGDPSKRDLIRGFRREMDEIARVAADFLKKYETIGVDASLASEFGKELATIGHVLGQRINKEESVLYPLYMPSYG